MKTKPALPLLALAAGLAFSLPAIGASHEHAKPAAPAAADAGRLDAPADKDAAWLARARAEYPLKTCVVSKEDLGSMGDSPEYIYRRNGQPDRLVRFCCDSCVDDFKKAPAKYLQKIDDAAKPAAKSHH